MTEGKRRYSSTQTAEEFLAELHDDPEWVAAEALRDREFERVGAALAAAEQPILADLRQIGVEVSETWDLIERPAYPQVAELLLSHLGRDYPDAILEGLARALGAQASLQHWEAMAQAFRGKSPERVRVGLAESLTMVGGNTQVVEMADLAADPANGPSRILLLEPLVRTEEGRRRLESFQDDNVLGHEARRLLRKRSAQAGADRLRAKYQPTTADLAELGSIDVDLERVGLLMRALGAALGLDDGCRRAVAKMAGSLDVGEGQVLECRSRHGPIRIELFADDIDAIDLDVYGRPSAGGTVDQVLRSYFEPH